MEKITAIYCRTACQHPNDPPACVMQEQRALLYARENGHTNIRVFSDSGFSGLNFQRPAFAQMQQAIEGGQVCTVIVKSICRISRSMSDALKWVRQAQGRGVHIVALDHDLDFTDVLLDRLVEMGRNAKK